MSGPTALPRSLTGAWKLSDMTGLDYRILLFLAEWEASARPMPTTAKIAQHLHTNRAAVERGILLCKCQGYHFGYEQLPCGAVVAPFEYGAST